MQAEELPQVGAQNGSLGPFQPLGIWMHRPSLPPSVARSQGALTWLQLCVHQGKGAYSLSWQTRLPPQRPSAVHASPKPGKVTTSALLASWETLTGLAQALKRPQRNRQNLMVLLPVHTLDSPLPLCQSCAMPTPIASLHNVSKRFLDVEALRGVNLTLPQGISGLLGPNGAGKSTLFRLLLGLDRADTGSVHVLDHPLPDEGVQVRAQIGYMPEDDSLFPEMTATDQVIHAAQLSGLKLQDASTRAHQALDLVGLADNRYRKAETFSLGQRQRLRLAMALVHGPRLLIVDEPTAGLDPDGRAEMLNLLAETGKQGTSVLLSTHILADVEAICTYVVLMNRGQVTFAGAMNTFRQNDGGPVYLLRVEGDVQKLLELLNQQGIIAKQQDAELSVQLPRERLGELWQACAQAGVGVSGLRAGQEDMAHAFLRHVHGDFQQQVNS